MKRYILSTYLDNDPNAGPKARRDIESIVIEEGYLKVFLRKRFLSGRFKVIRQLYMLVVDLLKMFFSIERKSLLLISVPLPFTKWQTPFIGGFFGLLRVIKQTEIVFSVIDIDSFRRTDKQHKGEWDILRTGSCFILHTGPMREIFSKKGFDTEKVVLIHLFDYLSEFDPETKQRTLTKEVVFAGNLEQNKCGFLSKLIELEDKITFNLYGKPAMTCGLSDSIRYKGSATPENIIGVIEGSFGLVWDGFSLDTCSGTIGEYLKINAPHKTSLYLAAGLPVIIWKEAAMAELILKENLGFAVESLREIGGIINNMTEDSYNQMRVNVLRYSPQLKEGHFFKEALAKVYEKI